MFKQGIYILFEETISDNAKYFNTRLQMSEEFIQQNIARGSNEFPNKNFTF